MTKINAFEYHRTIKFADTDAAGVVYFASLLSICHEAYEEYLIAELNLDLNKFFRDQFTALPIVHAEIDFHHPLFCGDKIVIYISPELISHKVFNMHYQILQSQVMVATASTRHICINPQNRKTQPLPDLFEQKLRNTPW